MRRNNMEIREKEPIKEFLDRCKGKKCYLFGAGGIGRSVLELRKEILSNIQIEGFLDNDVNKWGTHFQGYLVSGVDILKKIDEDSYVVLITSYSAEDIKAQLKRFGVKNIFNARTLWGVGRTYTTDEIEKIEQVKGLLADEKSRKNIEKIMTYRNAGISDWHDLYEPEQYFPKDVIKLGEAEVFVDCGAFTGDTVQEFIRQCNGVYQKIYAFEPVEENFLIMRQQYEMEKRVACIQAGLADKEAVLRFSENKDLMSAGRISEYGESKTIITTIDARIKENVTFIKMDIEGYELLALHGAAETIQRDKPKLAICIYHKAEDLYEIPQYIKSLVPEYKLYIRHHMPAGYETVLYAVV